MPRSSPSELVNVLHVRVVTGQGGGPDKTILRSPRYMRERGYEELCAYLRPANDAGFSALQQHANDERAEVIGIDDRGPLDWRVVRRLVEVCRRRHVRIWHGHDYKSNALGLLVSRWHALRLVTTAHGWVHHTRRTPLYYFVDRCCLRWYERVLCVSPDLQSACRRAGVRAHRCQLVANGIEPQRFVRRMQPAAARRQLGLDPTLPLLGAVGRLAPEKNFRALLSAAQALLARGLRFQIVLVGGGADRSALQEETQRRGLKDVVHFAGHCADVRPWYEAMDVFVLSSLREAMPNVVLEAMAMEVPVVATSIAGVPDMLAHGEAGLLVPPDDTARLASAMGQLLESLELRCSLAAKARVRAATTFSFERRMDRMQAIYDELLHPTPRSAT